MMKILKTPWKKDLLSLASNSSRSIKITSPFIRQDVCSELLQCKRPRTKLELITSFKLISVYSGVLDLEAIDEILENGGVVKNYPRLHSKIYLFDEKAAVVTSSNLTNGGLLNNFEYGLLLDDPYLVARIAQDYSLLLGDEKTGTVKASDVATVREMLLRVSKAAPVKLPPFKLGAQKEPPDVIETRVEPIMNSISGWSRDVFECVESIPKSVFSLSDVYHFESQLQSKHKSNKHVSDKIRQQLQRLRDLGLIEFLGSGRYRKLWKSTD